VLLYEQSPPTRAKIFIGNVKKIWLYSLILLILGMFLFTWRSLNLPVTSIATTQKDTTTQSKKLEYETRTFPDTLKKGDWGDQKSRCCFCIMAPISLFINHNYV
jgi:hypothetical protein